MLRYQSLVVAKFTFEQLKRGHSSIASTYSWEGHCKNEAVQFYWCSSYFSVTTTAMVVK